MEEHVDGFVGYLKREQRATWTLLKISEKDGLVVIDPEADAVTGTDRLLLTFPGLHDILTTLINQRAEERLDVRKSFRPSLPHPLRRKGAHTPASTSSVERL